MLDKFPPQIHRFLKFYIYIYIDPRNSEIFYIGKGTGDRAFAHLSEISEKAKVKRIEDIRKDGLEPKIEIVIHGIEDSETAQRIEASIIDCFGKDKLTNLQRGYRSKEFGRMSLEQIIATYQYDSVEVTEKMIAFKLNKTFRYGLSAMELYDFTRHSWKISKRKDKAKYAVAVYQGIIQEVYEIRGWLPQNSTLNSKYLGVKQPASNTVRWEFIGTIADEKIRKKYLYKNISKYFKSNQFPFEYINC